MDLYDFFSSIITAIAGDSALESWAQSNFGDSVQVFADISSASPPQAADMPYVIVHSPGAVKNQQRRVREYTLAVDLALSKDALKTRAESNLEEPAGLVLLDFATLVAAAVASALSGSMSFGYSLAADTLGSLPQVYGYMDFEFSEPVTIGSDPLD